MTLVLSVHSRDSLWLVADRRLSYGGRRAPVDSAVKVMHLETKDGVGLLGYAGLGATPRGTQPSEWMSGVLRGRAGLTFEQALAVLSAAAARELPRHLARTPGGAHFVVVPAFVTDLGSRLYSIENEVAGGRQWYRYTSHQRAAEPTSPSVRMAVAGTGGVYLAQSRGWQRALLSLVNAHDRGRVSDHAVADRLAALNYVAHQGVHDGSVGPRCIVVWRRRRDARPGPPGGAHQFYTGTDREQDSGTIPAIVNGIDVQAVGGVMGTVFSAAIARHGFEVPFDFDEVELQRLLAELPSEPDEDFR